MADSSKITRVVSIGDPGDTQQQISAALTAQPDFQLVDVLVSFERLARDLGAAAPNIILMDHQLGGEPTLDIIDDIALQLPDTAIVAILKESDPVEIQQVLMAGARGFIIQPFTQISLLSTLRRVSELEGRREKAAAGSHFTAAEKARPIHSVAVYSPRGGVGTTTIATNLAISLMERTGLQVLLVDGKLSFGHLDVMLNVRTQNTIADLLPHASGLDDALIHDVVVRHSSGLNVLMAPANLQVSQGIRPDDLYSVYMQLLKKFDLIVIDAGSALTENTVTLLDAADKIILLTTPDLATLHDISRFVQLSRSLAYSPDKFLYVVNREGELGGVKTQDINSALHQPIFARIPEDTGNALRSINRGIPLIIRYPRSPASKAINELSNRLLDMTTTELVEGFTESTSAPHQDQLLVSSQLG